MKGLKIIPIFTVLLMCTYVGIRFVEANRDVVTVQFVGYQSRPAPLGLVVLTSVLIGMIFAGALCSLELMVLVMQNRKLRRRVPSHGSPGAVVPRDEHTSTNVTGSFNVPDDEPESASELSEPKSTNRFTPL